LSAGEGKEKNPNYIMLFVSNNKWRGKSLGKAMGASETSLECCHKPPSLQYLQVPTYTLYTTFLMQW